MGNFKKYQKNDKKGASEKQVKQGRIGKPQKSRKHKIKPINRTPLPEKGKHKEKNLEPKEEDDQWIPRRAKEIMWAQNDLKSKKKKKKRKNALFDHKDKGVTRPMDKVPKFVQGREESDFDFSKRVDQETKMMLLMSKAKAKMKVSSDELGDPDKPTDKNSLKRSEMKKQRNRDYKKLKIEAQKIKKLEKKGDFAFLKDDVTFGEVVNQPPSITAKPRKAQSLGNIDKPGTKSLLLKQMFDAGNSDSDSESKVKQKHLATRPVGKTIKRKHLSFGEQRINDADRERAIGLYRQIKAKKLKASSENS